MHNNVPVDNTIIHCGTSFCSTLSRDS